VLLPWVTLANYGEKLGESGQRRAEGKAWVGEPGLPVKLGKNRRERLGLVKRGAPAAGNADQPPILTMEAA
jgi:hypothetical protein